MVSLVLAPVVLGVAIYYLPTWLAKLVVAVGQIGIAALGVYFFMRSASQGPFYEALIGDNRLLYISLRGDRPSLALVLLTSLLFIAVLAYSWREEYSTKKFLLLMLIMQGLIAGIFLTEDIFNLFVLVEVTTVVGIILLLFRKGYRSFYDGLYYLTVQIVAMMFFLFAIAFLYRAFGVLSISYMTAMISAGTVEGQALVLPFAFILAGLGLKTGLFPLMSWVPRCYGNPGAPLPVITVMSAVVIKGSVVWLVRLTAMFSPVLDMSTYVIIAAVVTAAASTVMALRQSDIRVLLAYSTIAQVALITIGFLISDPVSSNGAFFHILHHGAIKTLLFLAAGMIVAVYGTGRIQDISGVARRMPLATLVTAVAMAGMIGLPFTAGGASKYWIASGVSDTWLVWALYLVNFGTMMVTVRFARMFFGPVSPSALRKRDPAPSVLPSLSDSAAARGAVDALPVASMRTMQVVSATLAVVILAAGVLAPWLASTVTGTPMSLPTASLLGKLPELLITALLAVGLYTALHIRLRSTVLTDRGLSLPHAVLALVGFFTVTLAVGMMR